MIVLSLLPENVFIFKIKKMDTIEARVNLDMERGKLKQKFAKLMDDDLLFEEGKRDEMYGKQQSRLRETELELYRILTEL